MAQTIVAACLKATIEVIKEETRLELEGPPPPPLAETVPGANGPDGSKEPDQSRVANPSGKIIRFDPRKGCYEITYVEKADGENVLRRSIKGLHVKCHNKAGARLTEEKCTEAMHRACEKAKKLWNQSDRSERARFELSD